MAWCASEDEICQAMERQWGKDPKGSEIAPPPDAQLPTPSQLGITAGILSDVPVHLQVPPTDWSNGIAPMGYEGLQSAAQVLPSMPDAVLLSNPINSNAAVAVQANGGVLGKVSGIYHKVIDAAESPGFTNFLKQQGGYVNRAGDYVGLGGTGLAVAGAATAQPELVAPGLAGIAVGEVLNKLGNGAIVLSDVLANNRNQAVKDAVGAGVSSVLPPLVDPQPFIDRAGKYYGY